MKVSADISSATLLLDDAINKRVLRKIDLILLSVRSGALGNVSTDNHTASYYLLWMP